MDRGRVGENGLHARERRLDIERGGLLSGSRRHHTPGFGDGIRAGRRLGQLRDRLRSHAPPLHVLQPAVPVKRALVVAGLLVGPTIGVAQGTGVVYGTVRDSAGHPLMATVYLVTGTATAYADSGGRYRLVVPAGSVIIRANFVARTPVQAALTVLPGDSVSHDFVLTPTPATVDIGTPIIELRPVVTTAAKRSQLLDEAVTSVAIVSDSEIARRAVNTIDEAVD